MHPVDSPNKIPVHAYIEYAHQRMARQLIAFAHRLIPIAARPRVEPEDVVQSVFRSLIRRGGRPLLGGWDGLWGLLVVMTRRKCQRQTRDAFATRRDVRAEVSAANRNDDWDFPDPIAMPLEETAVAELITRLADGLDDRDRMVLGFHIQGYTQIEISTRLGYAVRTVRRSVDRIRSRYTQLSESD